MGCNKLKYQLSLYIDGELEGDELTKVKAHLEQCPKCMEYCNVLKETKHHCSSMEWENLPQGFHRILQQKLNKEGENQMSKKRWILSIALGLVSVLVIVVMGASLMDALWSRTNQSKSGGDPKHNYDSNSDMNREPPGDSNSGSPQIGPGEKSEDGWADGDYESPRDVVGEEGGEIDRKIVKAAYLAVETLEFDVLIGNLEGKVKVMGGYPESSNVQGVPRERKDNSFTRRASYEIRIPNKKFEQFINEVGELGNLITKEVSGENVTGKYIDTEARVKSLKIQEDRLLSILNKAERLQEIMELERELSRVRYDIESYTGTLKRLDQLVNYSRINIDIYEVKELKNIEESEPETLWARIGEAFRSSLKNLGNFFENLTVFLVAAMPYLVLLIPLAWLIWILAVKIVGSRNKEKDGEHGEE